MKRDQDEKAVQVLAYLRKLPADHPYVQEEMSLRRERIIHERVVVSGKAGLWGYLRGVFREGHPKPNGVFLIMFTFQNFSSAYAITYYSPTLFGSLGIQDINLYTDIYGPVKAVSSIIFYIYFIEL
ncbi:uncharacterized protein L203_101751 [Cryptococcus depauperatus CBS 7841]|uniref:Uncharacterized protein n=1 Tax=Cryptococcus depauperatus CBS 7841 TaxID=1295531 RepID=A0AAJ8JQM5_9TREE